METFNLTNSSLSSTLKRRWSSSFEEAGEGMKIKKKKRVKLSGTFLDQHKFFRKVGIWRLKKWKNKRKAKQKGYEISRRIGEKKKKEKGDNRVRISQCGNWSLPGTNLRGYCKLLLLLLFSSISKQEFCSLSFRWGVEEGDEAERNVSFHVM